MAPAELAPPHTEYSYSSCGRNTTPTNHRRSDQHTQHQNIAAASRLVCGRHHQNAGTQHQNIAAASRLVCGRRLAAWAASYQLQVVEAVAPTTDVSLPNIRQRSQHATPASIAQCFLMMSSPRHHGTLGRYGCCGKASYHQHVHARCHCWLGSSFLWDVGGGQISECDFMGSRSGFLTQQEYALAHFPREVD